jgi:hypothetical protein
MALEMQNRTPFKLQPLPLKAKNGADILRIVLKGGFAIGADGKLSLAEDQPEAVMADDHYGEPGASPVRYESDVIIDKLHTDLVINGHAYAPHGMPVKEMEVALGFQGSVMKRLRVSGDRSWYRGMVGWAMSRPVPFDRIPLTYDRAFGGQDNEGSEPRNRAGTGFAARMDKRCEGMKVPNIEFPDQLITSIGDRPAPAGLGVLAKHWEPRLGHAGTYDQAWLDEQYPLLPHDFNDLFFQSVGAEQWIPTPVGGEVIAVQGMTPEGFMRVELPPCRMGMQLVYKDHRERHQMRVETVLLEPDARRLVVTWGSCADIHGDPFRLLEVTTARVGEGFAADSTCRVC